MLWRIHQLRGILVGEKTRTVGEALNNVLRESLEDDGEVVVLGETVWSGGLWGVTRGLMEEFGDERVIETPVSENGIFEATLGLALSGYRPVVEIYSADFMMVVANEVINDMAKWRAQHSTPEILPITIRGPMGATGGLGPEHSQCVEKYFYSTPGLEVVVPGMPSSAAPLLSASIASDTPTLFFEHRRLYPMLVDDGVGAAPSELGKARLVRRGNDVTVVSWGAALLDALEAVTTLEEVGIDVELIELCSIAPMDFELVAHSASRTGHLVTVEEGTLFGGVGAEIVSTIVERSEQQVSVARVGMAHGIHSYTPQVESQILPSPSKIEAAIRRVLS